MLKGQNGCTKMENKVDFTQIPSPSISLFCLWTSQEPGEEAQYLGVKTAASPAGVQDTKYKTSQPVPASQICTQLLSGQITLD